MEAHVCMPDRGIAVGTPHADTEQPLAECEQPFEHAIEREIRAQGFLSERIARFAQPFRPERDIPVGEGFALPSLVCERLEFGKFATRCRQFRSWH